MLHTRTRSMFFPLACIDTPFLHNSRMRRPFCCARLGLFLLELLRPFLWLDGALPCGAMLSDDDIDSSLEEPEAAVAICAEHRHMYQQCPWPRFGMRCLTQVPVRISLVDQLGPMYVCFLPEQDMAESPTSQDSERTSTATSGPCACAYRVEAQRRGTLHVHSLLWQLPSLDDSDSAPSALAADEYSSASSASLRDYVSGYCCMRDPGNPGGEGAAGAQKITHEEDLV